MQYKSLHERWNEETASDFIVEKSKIKLEPIKPVKKKSKAQRIAKTFLEILKFNPYHGKDGRFTTASGYTSFTYSPGKSKAHDNAIAREKERAAAEQRKELGNNIVSITSHVRNEILDEFGIQGNRKEIDKQIVALYQDTAMNEGFRYADGKIVAKRAAHEKVKEFAKDLMSKQEIEDNSTASEYKELQRYVKGTPLNISAQDKSNIPDWNNYKKANFGNFTISNKGISVDSFYQELSSWYPHLFNKNITNPADQLQTISDTLKYLKPKKRNLSGYELQEATDQMADLLVRSYVTGWVNVTGNTAA